MIRNVQGSHLTATNRRHIEAILGKGWLRGTAPRLSYVLEPLPDRDGAYCFTIAARERDDWGRAQIRYAKGTFEHSPPIA